MLSWLFCLPGDPRPVPSAGPEGPVIPPRLLPQGGRSAPAFPGFRPRSGRRPPLIYFSFQRWMLAPFVRMISA